MARETRRTLKLTPEKKQQFIERLRATVNVTLAADEIGMSRRYMYQVREREPAFAELWDNAIDEGVDRLEAEVTRRAFAGVDKPVHYKGKRVDKVKEYSDTLAIFLLKAHRPEKYRDRVSAEVTGKDGGPIETKDVSARDELSSRITGIAARAGANGASSVH